MTIIYFNIYLLITLIISFLSIIYGKENTSTFYCLTKDDDCDGMACTNIADNNIKQSLYLSSNFVALSKEKIGKKYCGNKFMILNIDPDCPNTIAFPDKYISRILIIADTCGSCNESHYDLDKISWLRVCGYVQNKGVFKSVGFVYDEVNKRISCLGKFNKEICVKLTEYVGYSLINNPIGSTITFSKNKIDDIFKGKVVDTIGDNIRYIKGSTSNITNIKDDILMDQESVDIYLQKLIDEAKDADKMNSSLAEINDDDEVTDVVDVVDSFNSTKDEYVVDESYYTDNLLSKSSNNIHHYIKYILIAIFSIVIIGLCIGTLNKIKKSKEINKKYPSNTLVDDENLNNLNQNSEKDSLEEAYVNNGTSWDMNRYTVTNSVLDKMKGYNAIKTINHQTFVYDY